jgi:UDP-N-acetylmuramyl tripeptide synthase
VAERWRGAVAALPSGTRLVVNVDDPLLADIAAGTEGALRFGLDDASAARERLSHAADSKYCVACGTPYHYTAAYVGHLGDYRCPRCGQSRPALDLAARSIFSSGLEGSSFELFTPAGSRRVSLPLPGLYNVYNAVAAAALSLALGASLEEIAAGLERFRPAFGRFERISVGDRTAVVLLVKNPAGANEVVRTITASGPSPVAVVALNDDIADGRDVSWIWDVDFEPLAVSLERLVATGARAQELALRFKYGGLEAERIEVEPDLGRALDRGLELVGAGGELFILPTYTAMLALRRIAVSRGLVRPYWELTSENAAHFPREGLVASLRSRGNGKRPP